MEKRLEGRRDEESGWYGRLARSHNWAGREDVRGFNYEGTAGKKGLRGRGFGWRRRLAGPQLGVRASRPRTGSAGDSVRRGGRYEGPPHKKPHPASAAPCASSRSLDQPLRFLRKKKGPHLLPSARPLLLEQQQPDCVRPVRRPGSLPRSPVAEPTRRAVRLAQPLDANFCRRQIWHASCHCDSAPASLASRRAKCNGDYGYGCFRVDFGHNSLLADAKLVRTAQPNDVPGG